MWSLKKKEREMAANFVQEEIRASNYNLTRASINDNYDCWMKKTFWERYTEWITRIVHLVLFREKLAGAAERHGIGMTSWLDSVPFVPSDITSMVDYFKERAQMDHLKASIWFVGVTGISRRYVDITLLLENRVTSGFYLPQPPNLSIEAIDSHRLVLQFSPCWLYVLLNSLITTITWLKLLIT